jgi:branched-chain amino acid transport system permease protein
VKFFRGETVQRLVLPAIFMAVLAAIPLFARNAGDVYYLSLLSRMMIFAIAAVSLNLILGFGGMVSFGHAAFVGIGAYATGIAVANGFNNGFLHLALIVIVCGGSALVIGFASVRTSGLYFIMITLAFAQLAYFLGVGLKQYGGDDGFNLQSRSEFGAWLDLTDPRTFYYTVWVSLALVVLAMSRLIRSRFGAALKGIRLNERRINSLGLPSRRYKLATFVISGITCGLAGMWLANLTQFVGPAYMHWTRSGELLIIVILGGTSTVFGPVIGAVLYLAMEEFLSAYSEHWQLAVGLLLVIFVLFLKDGPLRQLQKQVPSTGWR